MKFETTFKTEHTNVDSVLQGRLL